MAYSSPVIQLAVYACLLLIYWVGAYIIGFDHRRIIEPDRLCDAEIDGAMMLFVVLILITIARSPGAQNHGGSGRKEQPDGKVECGGYC